PLAGAARSHRGEDQGQPAGQTHPHRGAHRRCRLGGAEPQGVAEPRRRGADGAHRARRRARAAAVRRLRQHASARPTENGGCARKEPARRLHHRGKATMTRPKTHLLALALALGPAGRAAAQDVALADPVEPPATGAAKPGEVALETNREIDLANIVVSAAKGVTTLQEAPAIINIITSEEIKARGFRFVEDALASIPGWTFTSTFGQQL